MNIPKDPKIVVQKAVLNNIQKYLNYISSLIPKKSATVSGKTTEPFSI